jgi:ribonuclease HI
MTKSSDPSQLLGIIINNLNCQADRHRGWFIGHFIDQDSPFYTTDFEVKWHHVAAGQSKPEWGTNQTAKTLTILIHGHIKISFKQSPHNYSVELIKQGDYAFWPAQVAHSWQALEDSLAVAVRWPSRPDDQTGKQISETTQTSLNIYCDGAARGNPGPAAAAYVIQDHAGHTITEQGTYLGHQTNNYAEYQAVLHALQWLTTHPTDPKPQHLNFHLDSQLVTNQLTGQYQVKQPTLKQLHTQALQIINHLTKQGTQVNFHHIYRLHNARADFLANQTLDHHSK